MTAALAGLLLGLAGSVHCAGMCGPLVIAVTGGRAGSRGAALRRMLAYHAARVSMYVLLAVPAGYAGRTLSFGLWGRGIGLLAGVLLVVAALGWTRTTWTRQASAAWSVGIGRAGARAMAFARRHQRAGTIVLGAVNGLLPCGLVYAAVVASAATGSIAGAVLFMAGFGAATVPVLLAVALSAASVPAGVRARLRFAGPALMAIAGVLLIVRAVMPPDAAHSGHSRGPAARTAAAPHQAHR